jgi:cell division protein FtsB
MTKTSSRERIKIFGPWLLVMCLVLTSLSIGRQVLKKRSIQREIDAIKAEIAATDQQNAELANLLQYIQSPSYTEEQARLRFGYAKPDEKLAIIPKGSVLGSSTDAESDTNTPTDSNFQSWWRYFFKP